MEWCVQEDLNKISDWFRANKLTLNTSKSNFILFKKQNRKLNATINLKVGTETLPQTNSVKFLGVWLDKNLNWVDHVNKLLLKLKRNISLLKVSRNILICQVKRTVYYAHIYSHIKYGISVWGPMISKGQLTKLRKVQTDCVKLICRTNNVTNNTFVDLQLLSVKQIVILEMSKVMYKSLIKEFQPN